MRTLIAALLATFVTVAGSIGFAAADPWKDESGNQVWKHRSSGHYDRRYDRRKDGRRFQHSLEIPKGHLPPPGECRGWNHNRPAGHQPPPFRCRWFSS
jgi:hypothetical protein